MDDEDARYFKERKQELVEHDILPERQAEVVALRELGFEGANEIADELGVQPGTAGGYIERVENKVTKALQLLEAVGELRECAECGELCRAEHLGEKNDELVCRACRL